MTAAQLNAEILRNLGTLAEDEGMLKRVRKISSLRLSVLRNNLARVLQVLMSLTSIFAVYEPIQGYHRGGSKKNYKQNNSKIFKFHLKGLVVDENMIIFAGRKETDSSR